MKHMKHKKTLSSLQPKLEVTHFLISKRITKLPSKVVIQNILQCNANSTTGK